MVKIKIIATPPAKEIPENMRNQLVGLMFFVEKVNGGYAVEKETALELIREKGPEGSKAAEWYRLFFEDCQEIFFPKEVCRLV